MPGLMELIQSLRGGLPGQQAQAPQNASIAQMMTPQAQPQIDPKTQMTAMAPPVQIAQKPQGLRGMLGLDNEVSGSGFSRGDFGALALSQFANQQGGQSGGGNVVNSMLAAKMKQKQSDSARDKLVQQMRAAGYDEKDIVAVQFAPEQAIKAIYDRAAPYTLTEGQQRRDGNNQLVADAPKYAYQNDQILRQGADGVTNMGRLDPSYSDMETGRNNKVENQQGWARIGIEQQNADTSQKRLGMDAFYNKPFAQAQAKADVDQLSAARDAAGGATMNAPLLDELAGIVKTAPYGSMGGIASGWDAITIGDGLFGEGKAKDKFDRADQIVTKIVVPLARLMAPVSNTDFLQLKNTIANPTSSKAAVEAAVQTLQAEGKAAQQYEAAAREWTKVYGAPSATDPKGQTFNQFFAGWLNANREALGYPSGALTSAPQGQNAGDLLIDLNMNIIR